MSWLKILPPKPNGLGSNSDCLRITSLTQFLHKNYRTSLMRLLELNDFNKCKVLNKVSGIVSVNLLRCSQYLRLDYSHQDGTPQGPRLHCSIRAQSTACTEQALSKESFTESSKPFSKANNVTIILQRQDLRLNTDKPDNLPKVRLPLSGRIRIGTAIYPSESKAWVLPPSHEEE